MSNRIVVVIAIAILARGAGAQDSSATKPKTAALAGMVRNAQGLPLKDATISVDKTELRAVTNDSGLFFLPKIPAGKSDFTVMRIGYGAVHFAIDLAADTTLVVNIPMKLVQTLPNVAVEGERVSTALMRAGYYDRRKTGLGSFIGEEKIAKLRHAMQPSTFLRDVRGFEVRCPSVGACVVRTSSGCVPTVYVNGAKRTGKLDEVVSPGEVFAMETYERQVLVPSEYYPAGCVVAVWTKGYADMPDKKP